MRPLGFLCILVVAGWYCGVSSAQAQDCACGGSSIGTPYAGGNGQPIKWLYDPHILSSPPPPGQKLICYFKQVANQSTADVRDVRWEVANFFRRIVPKGASPTSCPEVAGDTKTNPSNGRLHYGPSSEAYDTTVLQPKDGWGETASASTSGTAGRDAARVEDGKLNTALTFYIDDKEGKTVPARLILSSSMKSDGSKAFFTYFVSNESVAPIAVLVNLSANSAVLEMVPMLQRMFWMNPGETRSFNASSEGSKSIERAAIVVYDSNKNVSVIDSAAFYTIPGKKEVSDEMFWRR